MSAHRQKPTITAERVAWFARYYAHNCAWGVFHVWLEDGNYGLGGFAEWLGGFAEWLDGQPVDVRAAATWFLTLTPSQQRRLGLKAEDVAMASGWGKWDAVLPVVGAWP